MHVCWAVHINVLKLLHRVSINVCIYVQECIQAVLISPVLMVVLRRMTRLQVTTCYSHFRGWPWFWPTKVKAMTPTSIAILVRHSQTCNFIAESSNPASAVAVRATLNSLKFLIVLCYVLIGLSVLYLNSFLQNWWLCPLWQKCLWHCQMELWCRWLELRGVAP